MPPARKLTPEQHIENLERRSSESLLKAQKREVIRCMEIAPACIPHILSKLSCLNMRLKDVQHEGGNNGGGRIPASLPQAAAQRRSTAHASTEPSQVDADDSQELTPTKYNKIESCSVSFMLEKILETVEPSAMSVPNLKRMLTRGQSDANKTSLVKLVEMATGMASDHPITGRLCTLKAFQAYCQERYTARGRRCRDIALPPVWPRDGIYRIVNMDERGLHVQHRFTKHIGTVPCDKMPPHSSITDLFVEYNWSESRAAVHSAKDPEGTLACGLQFLFPSQVVGNLPLDLAGGFDGDDGDRCGQGVQAKGRLALENGQLALPNAEAKRPLVEPAEAPPKKRCLAEPGPRSPHGGTELAKSTCAAASPSACLQEDGAATPHPVDGVESEIDTAEENNAGEVDERFILPPPPPQANEE